MMDDMISRAAAIEAIKPIRNCGDFISILMHLTAVDAVPVVHGRWVHHNGGFSDHYDCTACGKAIVLTSMWAYCPLCGAKMEAKNA